jgi:hypothetical protein
MNNPNKKPTKKPTKDLSGSDARGVFFSYTIIGVTRKSLNRVGKINK